MSHCHVCTMYVCVQSCVHTRLVTLHVMYVYVPHLINCNLQKKNLFSPIAF